MTKERLEAYRSNKEEMRELDYALNNRWKSENMIGNDTIFDYSKGYPIPQSVVGFDHERYERLQNRDMKRKEELNKECLAVEDFIESIKEPIERRIFRIYFTEGQKKVTQRYVAKKVHLSRSAVSKKIDDYLKVSHNSQK